MCVKKTTPYLIREHNFSKNQDRITKILTCVFIASLFLKIFSNSIPYGLAVTADVVLPLSGTFLVFWMIYCCQSADGKTQRQMFEPGYKGNSPPPDATSSSTSRPARGGFGGSGTSGTRTTSPPTREGSGAATRTATSTGGSAPGFRAFSGHGHRLGGK